MPFLIGYVQILSPVKSNLPSSDACVSMDVHLAVVIFHFGCLNHYFSIDHIHAT
jgi:hypothetical protein